MTGRSRLGPTGRGTGLALAGVLAFLAARGFGTPALVPVGIGFVLVVVAAVALVAVASARVRVTRTMSTRRPRAGERVEADVRIAGAPSGRLAMGALEWELDPGLAPLGRVAGVTHGAEGLRRIAVPHARRGEHALPPVRLRLSDPFGLARAMRTHGGTDRVLVVPRTVPATSDASSLGDRRRARRAAVGEDIAHLDGLREYRAGDPLSRVHWGQSAKRGRLHTKVFRADDGGGRVGAVLLALPAADAPAEDCELAVTAAASLARAAAAGAGRGRGVSLWPGDAPAPAECDWPEAEVRLARAVAGSGPGAGELMRRATRLLPPGTGVVLVTPVADEALAEAGRAARRAGLEAVVVLVGAAAADGAELESLGVPVVRAVDEAALAAAVRPPARDRRRAAHA